MSQILTGLKITQSPFGNCPNEQGNLHVGGKIYNSCSTKSYTATATITAADLVANSIFKVTVTTAAITLTLPTATNLAAALPSDVSEGFSFNLLVAENGAAGGNTFTIATNTGATIFGGALPSGLTADATTNLKFVITGITVPSYEVYVL